MDLSNIQNSKTIKVINLALESSTTSPANMVTSSRTKDFMTHFPRPKNHIDNIVDKIKPTTKNGENNFTISHNLTVKWITRT